AGIRRICIFHLGAVARGSRARAFPQPERESMSTILSSMPSKKRKISKAQRDRLISTASPILLLLLWQAAAQTGLIDVRFFPAPTHIFSTFIALVEDGSLWDNTSATLLRLLWGGLIGGIPALLLGVCTG